MKTYRVYGYNYDDEEMSIRVNAESEEEAREMVEDAFYYGTTYVVEVKDSKMDGNDIPDYTGDWSDQLC